MCDSIRVVISMLTRLCFASFVRTCIWDKCTLYLKQLHHFLNGTNMKYNNNESFDPPITFVQWSETKKKKKYKTSV